MRTRMVFVLVALVGFLLTQAAQAYYNPSTGRWLSRDPIEERGGPNLSAFVGNDSTERFDLLGLEVSIDQSDPKHPGGRCALNQTCRDNIRLLLALINAASQRLATDFTSAYLQLAKDKTPIPPDKIYNPNVTDYRTSWNNHVQELINTLGRATECITVIGAQKKDGKCGCCKWFDDKRLRWREQEIERLKGQVPNTINALYWLTDAAGAFVGSSVSWGTEPSPAAVGVAGAAALLLVPGGEPEGAALLGGCLTGL